MKYWVTVECLSEVLKLNRGKTTKLEYGMARNLQAQGQVRIIEPEVLDYIAKQGIVSDDAYLSRNGWSGNQMTRVAWIQNADRIGGAELTNYHTVKIGNRLGFDIIGIAGSTRIPYADDSQIIITNNLHFWNQPGDEVVFRAYLKASSKPMVLFSHDLLETDPALFIKADLIVFLSPAHKRFYQNLFKLDLEKSICLPLAIDTSRYYKKDNKESKRIAGTCFIPNSWKWPTKSREYMQAHQDMKFTVAGASGGKADPDFRGMVDFYNQAEYAVHLPEKEYAGERVLFEAVLCGCKVIADANSGHKSWSEVFDWQDPAVLKEKLDEAPYLFWKAVEGVLK